MAGPGLGGGRLPMVDGGLVAAVARALVGCIVLGLFRLRVARHG